MKILKIVILSLLIIDSMSFFGLNIKGIPFIRNYSKTEYNGGAQNWDIAQAPNGIMYFANNEGVMEFDGNNWRMIAMPNNSVVRSVAIDSLHNIYVGAFNEFGVIKPDDQGKMKFHSFTHLLPPDLNNFNEVWRIHPYREGIVFQTFQEIFYLKNNQIHTIQSGSGFHYSFLIDNELYIQDIQKGLCRIEGQTAVPIEGGKIFMGKEIIEILHFSNNRLLIVTAQHGIFIYNQGRVNLWSSEINKALGNNQLFSATPLNNNRYAIGSVRNGLYIINHEGNIITNLNTKNGLQNNTILSIFSDHRKNLWLGLDNGIGYIKSASPLSILPDKQKIGSGYASAYFNNRLYFGTNTGLYYKTDNNDAEEDEFRLVENTSGQVWSLQIIEGELICGHNKGTFRIEGDKGNLLSSIEGGWVYLYDKQRYPGKMIGGTYSGLILFEKNTGTKNRWEFSKKVENFDESSREMAWDNNGAIWMSHGFKGIYHIVLNEEMDRCTNVDFYGEDNGFKSNFNISVNKIRDEIVFSSPDGFYRYVSQTDSFIPDKTFNNIFGKEKRVTRLFEEENGNIWFFQDKKVGYLKLQIDNSYEKITAPFAPIEGTFIGAFETVNPINNANILIGNEWGFVLYNPYYETSANKDLNVFIRQVSTIYSDSVLYYGKSGGIKHNADVPASEPNEIAFKNNALRFQFSAPDFRNPGFIQYRYQLVGFDQTPSPWTYDIQKDYTNIPEGEYVFQVQARNNAGVISKFDTYSFIVDPPWRRSTAAFVIYTLFLMAILLAMAWLARRRMHIVRAQMHQKKEEELQAQEQKFREEALMAERKIMQLNNEKLQDEVDFKNRELASSIMNITHKNEVLSHAVKELKYTQKKIKDAQSLFHIKQLIKTIHSELENNEDWEKFEVHFDSVHENFLKKLRERFPHLTPKDQRLCAYLKMNLTTKEIAPLLNISVRGAEISRYRLRKKLKLNRDENLVDFLLSL